MKRAAFILALILIPGALFRLVGVSWDADQHLHPDERFLTMVESSLSMPGVKQATNAPPPGCAKGGGYFDTPCSSLNPYNHNFGLFVYGTFPIFLTRLIGEVSHQTGYGEIHLVGRVLSALFDLSSVLLIFFIGRRLYGVPAAILGTLFLAASVLDIQQSHFFTVDTFTNVPIILAFWFALDIVHGRGLRAFLLAGAMFGLALAGRINIAPFAAVLIAGALLRAYLGDEWRLSSDEANVTRHLSLDTLSRAFGGLVAAAIATVIVFRIFQPYAANGPNFLSPTFPRFDFSHGGVGVLFDIALAWAGGVNPKFADNMAYIGDLVSGKIDYPPGHQWTDRAPYIFPLQNMLLWGLGLPLGLAAWAGFLVALYQLIRYKEWKHLLIVVWVGITFGYSGQQFAKTMRYFLQIYPFLALLAGYFIVQLWDAVSHPSAVREHVIASAFATLSINSAKQSPRSVEIASAQMVRLAMTRPDLHRLRTSLAKAAVALFAIIVIAYTLFWSTAFTTIYTRPVSRVTASRWMIATIPPGSVIANEHWDDPLPLRVDGQDPFGGMFRGLKSSSDGLMQWYAEDTPEKRTQAIQWLDEADYIVLSSNRLYQSIPRLPMRYPMTTKYYQWLFDGTLGFDNVATFTSRPQLFGIEINDDDAEESFTVYDHPKALIFKKTPRYSHANTAALFNSIDLSEVYRLMPLQATQAKTALMLTPAESDVQTRGGTWSQIFDPNDLINRFPVLGWIAMIEAMGWLAFPIAFIVFRALADRGFIFAKALGILIPAWGAWMLASFHALPFSRASIILIVAFVALVSAFIVWRRGREMIGYVRAQGAVVWVEEFLYLGFFGMFLAIRYGNPDLWHPNFGGEKPMDFAYLNAVTRSTWFPPYDPWFAGGYINYYYFGQLITATLLRLSGIVPEVAYNLALPMYFAMTAMGAFSVAFNLTARAGRPLLSPLIAGLLGALFVAVIGNLGELVLIIDTIIKMGGVSPIDIPVLSSVISLIVGIWRVFVERVPIEIPIGWWYWNATRVIPDTINEFPFFTFLYADLHAHLMSLLFTLVVLGLGVNFILRERDDPSRLPFLARWPISPMDVVEIIVASLALGALRAINTWDFPTYFAVIVGALAIGEYARRRKIDWAGVIAVAWRLGAIFVLSSVLYQPFISHLATAYTSIELWTAKRTALVEYLEVHGIFIFVIATFLVWQTFDSKHSRGTLRFLRLAIKHSSRLDQMLNLYQTLATPVPANAYQDLTTIAVAGSIVIELVLILTGLFVFALVYPLLVLAGLLVLRPDLSAPRRFIALLIAAGLAMTLMVEVSTLRGDIGRMNTVFKFYLQAWVFFGIAAAVAASEMWRTSPVVEPALSLSKDHSPPVLPKLWWAVFGFLLFAGILYPIFATRAKINDRFVAGSPPSLNGMDYMDAAVYHDNNRELILKYDREAIEWLRENIEGSPVILEGNAPLYHWASRVSSYTGMPTVIGWDWHQKQQRSIIDGSVIDHRIDTVRAIYSTRDANDALAMLKRFRASYIYVGDVERTFYDAPGLAKFDAMVRAGQLDMVYQNERVKIYKVKGS